MHVVRYLHEHFKVKIHFHFRSDVWYVFFSCAQNGLMIDVSRSTTLSVETITQAVSSVTESTLTAGATLDTTIIMDQSKVMSLSKAINIPFKFPIPKDVMAEMETPLLEYVQGLSNDKQFLHIVR